MGVIRYCQAGHAFVIDGTMAPGETIVVTVIPKSGYRFVKWEDGDATNPRTIYIEECGVKFVGIFEEDSPTPTEQYTITYNANGGDGDVPQSQTVNDGESVELASYSGEKEQHILLDGWSTSPSDSEIMYDFGEIVTPTGNMTLYAVWIRFGKVTIASSDEGMGIAKIEPSQNKYEYGTKYNVIVELKGDDYKFLRCVDNSDNIHFDAPNDNKIIFDSTVEDDSKHYVCDFYEENDSTQKIFLMTRTSNDTEIITNNFGKVPTVPYITNVSNDNTDHIEIISAQYKEDAEYPDEMESGYTLFIHKDYVLQSVDDNESLKFYDESHTEIDNIINYIDQHDDTYMKFEDEDYHIYTINCDEDEFLQQPSYFMVKLKANE